ncbi:MAG: type II secretion system GspH family protein [Chloroflexi bacterium]|nr:type II secretion system GspH family protein [Chloroflexota bacterium]
MKRIQGDEGGFTLVELLIVIALLAILFAVVLPNFSGFIDQGKVARNQADLDVVQVAIDAYITSARVSVIVSAMIGSAISDFSAAGTRAAGQPVLYPDLLRKRYPPSGIAYYWSGGGQVYQLSY